MSRKKTLTLAGAAVAAASALTWSAPAAACSSNPMLASVCLFGGTFAPRNWALTEGQLLPISQNQALFSLLGTMYGGDGRTTFQLPDLRGRVPMGASGSQEGLRSGVEFVTLTTPQIPAHMHTFDTTAQTTATLHGNAAFGNVKGPAGNSLAANMRDRDYQSAAPDVAMHGGSITATTDATMTLSVAGSSQSHENRQPYIAMNYIIALQGTFPSRN